MNKIEQFFGDTNNVDKVITTDLSEMYKEIGFENFYRETPVNSHIISELVNIDEG